MDHNEKKKLKKLKAMEESDDEEEGKTLLLTTTGARSYFPLFSYTPSLLIAATILPLPLPPPLPRTIVVQSVLSYDIGGNLNWELRGQRAPTTVTMEK